MFILIGLELPDSLRSLFGHSFPQLVWYALVISLAVMVVRSELNSYILESKLHAIEMKNCGFS